MSLTFLSLFLYLNDEDDTYIVSHCEDCAQDTPFRMEVVLNQREFFPFFCNVGELRCKREKKQLA